MFLREWQSLLIEFEWTIDDLFAPSGLVYWLEVELVRALGPDHAVTESRRIFDRKKGA